MRRALALISAGVTAAATVMVLAAPPALADPSANDWATLRQCEASGNYSTNSGNGYYGAYQFDLATWESVGGSGSPSGAAPAEQDYRALYLYRLRGWTPWICAALSGLKEESGARSGKVPSRAEAAYMRGGTGTYTVPNTGACNVGGSTAPAWGGQNFSQGNTYRDLICWQRQLGHLGYGLAGSGHFGANTLAALHRFQSAKGLPTSNVVNEQAWVAAWGRSGGVKSGGSAAEPPSIPKPTYGVERDLSLPSPVPSPTRPTPKPAPAPKPTPKPTPAPKPTAPGVKLFPGITAASCHVGATRAPSWPGMSFASGDYNRSLACWQMQMGHRGYRLTGNGFFGANTLAAAKDIQKRNHLGGTGLIGPKTWKAAWEGKVTA